MGAGKATATLNHVGITFQCSRNLHIGVSSGMVHDGSLVDGCGPSGVVKGGDGPRSLPNHWFSTPVEGPRGDQEESSALTSTGCRKLRRSLMT